MIPQFDKVAFTLVKARNEAKQVGDSHNFIDYALDEINLVPCEVCDEILHKDDAIKEYDYDREFITFTCKCCVEEGLKNE